MNLSESSVLKKLETYKLKKVNGGWRAQCPAHRGQDRNLAISFKDGKALFFCHSRQCSQTDIEQALSLDSPQELTQLKPIKGGRPIEYETRDQAGLLVAVQKRLLLPNGKKACPPWWEINGVKGLQGKKVNTFPLYGSQRIPSFDASRPIDICEGQPATEALLGVMAQALGTYGTSNEPSKEMLSWAKGKTLRLWPDNDEPGRKHMKLMAQRLLEAGAAKVMILDTSTLPPKGDAVEWLREQLAQEEANKQDIIEKLKGADVPGLTIVDATTLPKSGAAVHCLADIKPEKVVWLFENRIPRGDITLLVGDPGTGKSTFTIDLAARVTTGRALPGEPTRQPENVVYITAEDGLAKTVRPRLEAAGADLSRVFAVSGIYEGEEERGLLLPQDLPYLETVIKENKASLVILDPLMAFLGTKVDSHKDQEIRRVMGGLARIAASTGAAFIVVNHMNKASGGPALYRGAGSIGIIGAARSALLFAKDPEDKGDTGLRILAPLKSNLGPAPASLRLQVVGAVNGSSMIRFLGIASHDAEGLTSAPLPKEERSMVDSAVDVLRDILANGKVQSGEVAAQAKKQGVSERTLWRAKDRIGVVCKKDGAGAWFWSLPSIPFTVGMLGKDGSLPIKTDAYDSANHLGKDGSLGSLPQEDCPSNSANSANSANHQDNLGRDINYTNNFTFLNSANSANERDRGNESSIDWRLVGHIDADEAPM